LQEILSKAIAAAIMQSVWLLGCFQALKSFFRRLHWLLEFLWLMNDWSSITALASL